MEFKDLFKIEKPVIGMIHLAGAGSDKVKRALKELSIYEEEGVDGAIIEDYHGSPEDVRDALRESMDSGFKIVRGINVLGDPYSSFELARKYGAKFVQFDSVQSNHLNLDVYNKLRKEYSDVMVLGGVRFKYTSPTGNSLKEDIKYGKLRGEAIVTTGDGTGIETSLEKLKDFRKNLVGFPLIVGAGVNLENIYEQLSLTDGAIIGSYFKSNGNTNSNIDRKNVKNLMDVVKEVRKISS